MVSKDRRQIAVRVDEETYQNLGYQAGISGTSLTEYVRGYLIKLGNRVPKTENPKISTSTTVDLDQPEIEIQKEPPTVVTAEPIKQVKRKEVEPEIEPSESLEDEEEEKPKSLWERFQDFWDKPIITID